MKSAEPSFFNTEPFGMSFSQPVEIPSFFWTYYVNSPENQRHGKISAYAHVNDSVPIKILNVDYPEKNKLPWREIKDLAGIPISTTHLRTRQQWLAASTSTT